MKETLKNIKVAYNFAKKQKKYIVLYAICSAILCLIGLLSPLLAAQQLIKLTDSLFLQLLGISFVLFLVEISRNFINYANQKNSQIIFRETLIDLQKDLAEEILKIETKCVDNNSSGVFIQRLTNDANKISDIFYTLNEDIARIISNLGMLIAIFIINKIIFCYLIFCLTSLFIVERLRIKKVNKKDKIFRENHEKTSGLIGELVRGLRDIKMLNAENSFVSNIYNKIKIMNESRYDMSEVSRKFHLLRDCIMDFTDLTVIALLIAFIIKGVISIPNALIIQSYNNYIKSIIFYISDILDSLRDFNISSNRVFELLNDEKFNKEKFGKKHLKIVKGDFEFKNVNFAYEDKNVLNDLSFKVNANETVAFVGKSGAGKTTIFSLLCKMYDIKSGTITIDGNNINDLDRESIRGNITIINQNPYIFNMSIRENLSLVKENLTDKEMKKACKMACLDEFIESLPDKYDTIVGEGGVTLSGGQRQRLAIARALVQKTEIILFDEATSALDNETQASIQKAIDNMKNEYTILIIAHRLSTVINADRLLFIEDGHVVAEGTHKELLKKNKSYKELYEIELEK